MDLERSRYETFDELLDYCRRVASAVGLICIEIFGCRDPRPRDYAFNLGLALQLTNIIRDVAADLKRGRVYLPQEDLAHFGVQRGRSRAPAGDGADRALLAHECQRARASLRARPRRMPPAEARRWWPPRSWARSTSRSCSASSGAATTCSPSASACRGARQVAASPWPHAAAATLGRHARPDAIVIGGGFAGLSAAPLVEAGARVLVLEARRRLGGRATAFADPQTGELSTTASTCCSAAITRRWRFSSASAPPIDVGSQSGLTSRSSTRGRAVRWRLPACRRRCICSAGCWGGRALGWRERCRRCAWRIALRRLAPPRLTAATDRDGRSETVPALARGTARRRACASCSGSRWRSPRSTNRRSRRRPRISSRVLARMFGRTARDAALVLPARAARRAVCRARARMARGARRDGARQRAGQGPSSRRMRFAACACATRIESPLVISTVPWHAFPTLFAGDAPALDRLIGNAAALAASPIVTVNLWLDVPVCRSRSSACPAAPSSGSSTRRAHRRRARVASLAGRRAAPTRSSR